MTRCCAQQIEGDWWGTLRVGQTPLRVVFHLKRNPDGSWIGTLDSPDQGTTGIALSKVSVEGRQVTLTVESINGEFVGTLSEDGREIKGEWRQAGSTFPLTLTAGEPPKAKRPQEPKPPFPYRVEEVVIPHQQERFRLAGTLTLPTTKPPFPAIVFFTGSGAQNRDQAIFGHKPFLVLADYLTRRGYATLRMDDRGVGKSEGEMRNATTLDFVGDLLSGVAYLKKRREIDRRRIGVLGHSEGALVATIACAKAPKEIAFAILLAGTGVPGEQILYRQAELIAQKSGVPQSLIERNRKLQERVFEILKREPNNDIASEQIYRILLENLPSGSMLNDAQKTAIREQAKAYASPWFRTFVTLDPAPYLRRVRCPVLVLNGERDLQVDPDQNLPAIERALKEGGNRRFTIRRLPGLNHLFQKAATGLPAEYAQIEETFNESALQAIADWLDQTVRKQARR